MQAVRGWYNNHVESQIKLCTRRFIMHILYYRLINHCRHVAKVQAVSGRKLY